MKAMEDRIEIRRISITDLDTDAIVNAANEALLAGGGVCGAIFEAAGYQQMQEACNALSPCATGSAVITLVSTAIPFAKHGRGRWKHAEIFWRRIRTILSRSFSRFWTRRRCGLGTK